MRQRDKQAPQSAEEAVRDIRRATRRHFSAEEKIRIVVEGLRGEDSIAVLCRKEGIAQNLYYRWSVGSSSACYKNIRGRRKLSSCCGRQHRLSFGGSPHSRSILASARATCCR